MKKKIEDVKQGSVIRTDFGMMIVVNADFSKGLLQGYEVRTQGDNPFVVVYKGDEVNVVEEFGEVDS